MIRGAVFDVDGTLLDSMEIWDTAAARYLESLGIRAKEDLNEAIADMSIEEGLCYLKETYGLSQNFPELREGFLKIIEDFYRFEAPLKEGAGGFLAALQGKGVPMIVATSCEKKCVEAAFGRLGIGQYFLDILTCSEVGAGKTSPLIYQKACERLGTAPEETYVFEDALFAIRTAGRAGFQTVGVYERYYETEQKEIRQQADFYIKDFTQFREFWR